MTLHASLPKDRQAEGQFWITDGDDGATTYGPVRCRGEADRNAATAHDNPEEAPTEAFGDHPFGVSRVVHVVEVIAGDPRQHSYGPYFLALNPVSGEAWAARQAGRTGIGIHGGVPGPNGSLRPTYGCLRLTDAAIAAVASLVTAELAAGRAIFYECREAAP